MPVSVTVKDSIARFTGSGVVEPQDCIGAIDEAFGSNPAQLALWDFRRCSLSAVAAASFDAIARAVSQYATARGPDARTALCARDDPALRLLRAFIASADPGTRVRFEAFLDIDEALAWLHAESHAGDADDH